MARYIYLYLLINLNLYLGMVENLQKDATLLQNQLDNDTNYEIIRSLRSQLEIKEKEIVELQAEVKSMERIQKQQGLHLEKLNDKTDFVKKIRTLGGENRAQAERICNFITFKIYSHTRTEVKTGTRRETVP